MESVKWCVTEKKKHRKRKENLKDLSFLEILKEKWKFTRQNKIHKVYKSVN